MGKYIYDLSNPAKHPAAVIIAMSKQRHDEYGLADAVLHGHINKNLRE